MLYMGVITNLRQFVVVNLSSWPQQADKACAVAFLFHNYTTRVDYITPSHITIMKTRRRKPTIRHLIFLRLPAGYEYRPKPANWLRGKFHPTHHRHISLAPSPLSHIDCDVCKGGIGRKCVFVAASCTAETTNIFIDFVTYYAL